MMNRKKILVLVGMIWVALTIFYYFIYGIVKQVLDVRENGFDFISIAISIFPFVLSLWITYLLIRPLALRRSHATGCMIVLSLILAAPTILSVNQLIDQQMKKVDPMQHQALTNHFREQLESIQGNGTEITMKVKDLTDFAWDKLYLFGPYTSHTRINERLGYTWTNNTLLLVDDSQSLLVFISNGKVVQFLDISTRIQGDVSQIYTPERGVIQFSMLRTHNNEPYQPHIELVESSK